MRSIKNIGFLLLFVIGFNACAPRPVFRLQSLADQSTWYQGTEYIHSEADSIAVTTAYIRHAGDYVIFDVEVANYSDRVVRVDPALFEFKAFKSRSSNDALAAGWAIDPEKKLLQIDMEIADEKADQNTMLLFAAIGATAMVAEEVADDEEDTPQDEAGEAAVMYALAAGTSSEAEESEYEVHSLHNRRGRWAIETLRKTDLLPGEYIRGKVYFPIAEDANLFNIKVKAGNTIHTFRFHQLKYIN